MLNYLWKLSPVETGPWWPARQYVVDQMKKLGVKPGDIICRLGNSYVYGFFWFSEFIATVTGSKYSHAAMVLDVSDDILMADVNTTGLRRQFMVDWVDDVRGEEISILRFKGDEIVPQLAIENAKSVISLDPNYDPAFMDNDDGRNFYCVELVCWCYMRAGVMLCEEVPIRNLPGWSKKYNWFAKLHGVDTNKPVWCVGGKEVGLFSSKHLEEVGKISLSGLKRPKKAFSFSGA
jgi:hypothetical protein